MSREEDQALLAGDPIYKVRGKKPIHVIDRLLSRCTVQANGCVTFGGFINSSGYGHIGTGSLRDGTLGLTRTHRASWEFFRGPIPKGQYVLHHCDNRACCNPEHLFLGSAADNTADMMAKARNKGKVFRGEDHWAAKLKVADVLYIRESSLPTKALAEKYGVSCEQINGIKRKSTWRHV